MWGGDVGIAYHLGGWDIPVTTTTECLAQKKLEEKRKEYYAEDFYSNILRETFPEEFFEVKVTELSGKDFKFTGRRGQDSRELLKILKEELKKQGLLQEVQIDLLKRVKQRLYEDLTNFDRERDGEKLPWWFIALLEAIKMWNTVRYIKGAFLHTDDVNVTILYHLNPKAKVLMKKMGKPKRITKIEKGFTLVKDIFQYTTEEEYVKQQLIDKIEGGIEIIVSTGETNLLADEYHGIAKILNVTTEELIHEELDKDVTKRYFILKDNSDRIVGYKCERSYYHIYGTNTAFGEYWKILPLKPIIIELIQRYRQSVPAEVGYEQLYGRRKKFIIIAPSKRGIQKIESDWEYEPFKDC